jgi:23S rRNA (uridine2552-2'-O)-methyltransferase
VRYVLELGGAPGGWTQYVEQKIPHNGRLITVDPLDVKTGQKSIHICGLVGTDLVNHRIAEILNGTKVDIVISDMAPNISGINERDRAESLRLNVLTLGMAKTHLKKKGVVVMKTFQNPQVANLVEEIKNSFSSVRIVKPAASRKESSEVYVVAQGFRSLGGTGGSA